VTPKKSSLTGRYNILAPLKVLEINVIIYPQQKIFVKGARKRIFFEESVGSNISGCDKISLVALKLRVKISLFFSNSKRERQLLQGQVPENSFSGVWDGQPDVQEQMHFVPAKLPQESDSSDRFCYRFANIHR
jgi:hypothetical protein